MLDGRSLEFDSALTRFSVIVMHIDISGQLQLIGRAFDDVEANHYLQRGMRAFANALALVCVRMGAHLSL